MSLLKKALKSVVSGEISELTGKNKNDVKVAKLELKKTRIEQQAVQNQELKENVTKIVKYVGTNIEEIEAQIASLEVETKSLVDAYFAGDKKTKRKLFDKIDDKLPYLYLSRSFFSLLSKAASGIGLMENQNIFIVKFVPYFDGVDVLYGDVGASREVGLDLASAFVPMKKQFSFTDFMGEYGEGDEIVMPDVQTSIKTFKKTYSQIFTTNEPAKESELSSAVPTVRCPGCNAQLKEGTKFCPECGEKIVVAKLFCSECGNKVDPGVKFCPYCGKRM